MRKVAWLKNWWDWVGRHPTLVAVLIIFIVYLVYLPTTEYTKQYYDAEGYWLFGEKYFSTGSFAFLSYFNAIRGYFFPLLLAPLTRLSVNYGWTVMDLCRLLGAANAAAVFGWAGPVLWYTVKGGVPVSLGRRLLFAALGFALWRDYFNFCLTDFPALLAIGIALIGLLRGRGLASCLVAGIALAAAVNMRPVYQAAIPAIGLLVLLPAAGRPRWWGGARAAVLAVGMAVVMAPQAYSNHFHVGSWSPWVLTSMPDEPNLFLQQLGWGLEMQKYETNVGHSYPLASMRFEDQRGKALFASTGLTTFTEASQYVQLCVHRPWRALGVWLRHLFNGLDIQYATPYILDVYGLSWPLALLNYGLIWSGLLALFVRKWPRVSQTWLRPALVVLALLVPCLITLLTAIECRFLLPLHLLLSAAVVFGAAPLQWWRVAGRRWRLGVLASYVVVVVAGFSASASTQRHLAMQPRYILRDLPFSDVSLDDFLPAPAPEPW